MGICTKTPLKSSSNGRFYTGRVPSLPSGMWSCADGREVLFTRGRKAMWQRTPGGPVEWADPGESFQVIAEEAYDAKKGGRVLGEWARMMNQHHDRGSNGGNVTVLHQHADRRPRPSAPLPEKTIKPLDMSRWDDEPVPQQEWAVSDCIPLHKTAIFSGEGATGKSLLQLQLSAAHVLGREWLGIPVRKGPALFIDCEDDERVLHKRAADVLRLYDAKFADVVKGGLNLVSLAEQNTVLGWFNRGRGIIEPTPLFDELLEMVGDLKPVMTGIASSADVFAGSEIDRTQVRQFVALLTRLAKAAGGAVVLISHPSLTGIASGSGLSGSTGWHNSVRARMYLESVKAKEGEQADSNLRQIHFKKNQYGPISESITLRYQDGVFLPVTGTSFDAAVRSETAKEVFVKLLRRFTKENRNVNANTGPSYAPALFAVELDAHAHGVGKNDLAAAMRVLLEEEKIRHEPYGKPSRPHFRLVVSDGA
jgi:RecA-family ATPase